jgi:hypothetical protein
MKIRSFVMALAAAAAFAFTSSVALAGPFTAANNAAFNAANAKYGNESGVPDFQFTKSEFGNTELGQLIHLGAEVVVATVKGYTVIYNPATDAVHVYVNAGKGYSEPTMTTSTLKACGPGHWFTQNVGGKIWCTPAHLVGNSGGPTYSHTNPAIARSCTFDAASDGIDVHSC